MTDAQITARLERTLNSINAFLARGGSLGRNGNVNTRGCELVDRYDNLRTALCGDLGWHHPAWVAFCEAHNACRTHNGHDLFA